MQPDGDSPVDQAHRRRARSWSSRLRDLPAYHAMRDDCLDRGGHRRAGGQGRQPASNGSSPATFNRSFRRTAPAASPWHCASRRPHLVLQFRLGRPRRATGRSRPTRCSISRRCARCSRRRCWRRRSAKASSGSTTPPPNTSPSCSQAATSAASRSAQLATHTSGLLLPQDHPPWPDWGYTLPEFIRTLNAWKAEKEPGQAAPLYPRRLYSAAARARAPIRHCRSTS